MSSIQQSSRAVPREDRTDPAERRFRPAGSDQIQPLTAPSADLRLLSALEEMTARHLETSGRFRILRRMPARPLVPLEQAAAEGRRIGAIVDVETTGLDRNVDEVVEFGAVLFSFDDDGSIHDVVGTFSGLRQPTRRLAPEITRLTGITDEMLRGRSIDPAAVARFVEPAEFVLAHNAAFDRPFCERHFACFEEKAWACSLKEVAWGDLGRAGLKLGQLLAGGGFFHEGHRAVDDCLALLEVLAVGRNAGPPLAEILKSVAAVRIEIRAERAPYDSRQLLKKRGYRWSDGSDGQPKAWVVDVPENRYVSEIQFLHDDVYRTTFDPVWRRLDATNRYR